MTSEGHPGGHRNAATFRIRGWCRMRQTQRARPTPPGQEPGNSWEAGPQPGCPASQGQRRQLLSEAPEGHPWPLLLWCMKHKATKQGRGAFLLFSDVMSCGLGVDISQERTVRDLNLLMTDSRSVTEKEYVRRNRAPGPPASASDHGCLPKDMVQNYPPPGKIPKSRPRDPNSYPVHYKPLPSPVWVAPPLPSE